MELGDKNDGDWEMLISMTRLETELATVRRDVTEIKAHLAHEYVNKTEFTPVRNLVYGAVGMILTAVLGAIVTLVVM